jgi:hypothetical protein
MVVNKWIGLWAILTGGDVAGFAQGIGLIIEFSTWPQLPDDAQPTVRQAAVGVALGVTSMLWDMVTLGFAVTVSRTRRIPSRRRRTCLWARY